MIYFKNISAVLWLSLSAGLGQGFVNLNFESATLVQAFPPLTSYLVASSAIPSWTAYVNGNAQTRIGYNAVSLGGAIVSLNDINAPAAGALAPIQGNYSVYLLGEPNSRPISVGIGQTGTVPIGTQSISFWAEYYGGFVVTFNGQPVDYFVTSSTANYSVYAADISAYAGQTGELLFTAPARNALLLDNIQFSSTPVPEPGTLALGAMGAALMVFARRKINRL